MSSEGERRWPIGVGQTIVLIVALCFLAGALGWAIAQPADEKFNAVDVGFLSDMSTHHSGAIALSFNYLGRENDQGVGHFAREILLEQSQEIAVMNSLLDQAGSPPSGSDDVAMEWMGHAVAPGKMPGMPTRAESDALRASTGLAADDAFTELMIRHHAAGAVMGDYAAQHGENARVKKLAAAMAKVQRTEINEINARRRALGLANVDVGNVSAHSG